MAKKTHTCPQCKEQMNKGANKCHHCGSDYYWGIGDAFANWFADGKIEWHTVWHKTFIPKWKEQKWWVKGFIYLVILTIFISILL